jgi:hypothetical protein
MVSATFLIAVFKFGRNGVKAGGLVLKRRPLPDLMLLARKSEFSQGCLYLNCTFLTISTTF